MVKIELRVGDKVEVIKSDRARVGLKGTIFLADYDINNFGVEFDEPVVDCHGGDGKHKAGHCWYYYIEKAHGREVLRSMGEILTKAKKKNNFY